MYKNVKKTASICLYDIEKKIFFVKIKKVGNLELTRLFFHFCQVWEQ